jgi:L-ascorbate metabolism protein UlaG (beta-lactamase superfamily)
MKVTYYGQSAFLMELGGASLLFDPFITGNPKAPKIDLKTLKPDYILVSHGHGDHIGDTVAIAKNSGATVVCNFEIANWLNKQGVEKTIDLNIGGGRDFDFGRVQLVPAWHSSDLPDGTPGGTAGGFIVTHKNGAFYFSGDTALFNEMKIFGKRHKFDYVFLCLGDHYTMGYVDAAHAAEFLDCKNVIGMHFDTFPPITIDHQAAQDTFAKAGKSLKLPKPGENFTL